LQRGERARSAIGRWRDDSGGPMQVISVPVGRPTVHFEAPPAQRLPMEVDRFLAWFNTPQPTDGLIRTACVHLWFVTIHPYDDGNGRIARAIADMALAQDEGSADRFISMSRQIRREKTHYYDALEHAQRGDLDVTPWIQWFLACYARAAEHALVTLGEVLRGVSFWKRHQGVAFSERQRKVLERVLHQFEGKLTARKWAAIAKTSLDSAQRDIADLLARDVLIKNPGGSKNTSYAIREGGALP
jgi:Fic family protein